MRQIRALLAGFLFLMAFIASFSTQKAFCSVNSVSGLSINVERKIVIQDGGYIMINDTFLFISDDENAQLPQSYLIGIPSNYYGNLVYLSAHDPYGALQTEVSEEEDSFKWFNVSLRARVDRGQPYNFTLTTVFSNLIEREVENRFRAVFPLYPALRDEINLCNVTLILTPKAEVLMEDFPQEIFLNMTSDFRLLNNLTSPLPSYMNISSWVEFSDETFSILKILEVKREISVDGWGRIYATDLYDMNAVNVDILSIVLPPNSTDISIYDAYEKYPSSNMLIEENLEHNVIIKVILPDKLRNSEKIKLAVSYSLPYRRYVERNDWQKYTLRINITRPSEWFIPRITVSVLLPEGASAMGGDRHPQAINYEKIGFFQEKVTFVYYNVTKYKDLDSLSVKYQYIVLWAAFRPTILAIILIGLASIIVIFVKPPSGTKVLEFSSERLRALIEAYEDVERISSELESLRQQYTGGKIPKRRYQLTRKMIETQLHQAQKRFRELKAEIESSGGRYAEMVRQMEKASANIESSKRSIEEADLRLHRGEISAEEYRKITKEYARRIEKAKAVVEEVILKLKEEIL